MEDLSISRAWRARATGDTSSKKTDHHAIKEPLAQEFPHVHGAAWHDHQQTDGSAFHFLNPFGRLHFFWCAKRKSVFAARSHPGGAQSVECLFLVRQFAIVALVDGKRHVNDGTRNENDHS